MKSSTTFALFLLSCIMVFSACSLGENPDRFSSVPENTSAQNQVDSGEIENNKSSSIDDERVEKEMLITACYSLVLRGTDVMGWWFGDVWTGLGVPNNTEPSYLNLYYPITKFLNISHLKEETEKIFTKNFADKNFYSTVLRTDNERFKEHDDKLYANGDNGGWGLPFCPIKNYTVKSLSNSEGVVTVTVFNFSTHEDEVFEFTLLRENADADWRLDSYFSYVS